nr:uncharacterized protein LOC117681061 isoform X2 [Crassostrea gigas]
MGDKAGAMQSGTDEQIYQSWVFSFPKHWRQYTLRRDLPWFWSLLNAYDAYTQIILKTISDSSWNGEPICYPKSMEDEDFDNFVLKPYSTAKLQKISANTTRESSTHMQDDVIDNCREKKMSLVKLGEILLGYKRSLELAQQETSELHRHIEELKKAHHQSENKMPRQLKQIAKQKEDLNRSLELEREENSRLNRHIEEVKKAHHHSETRMSRQLKQIAKEKEDLLIRLSRIAGSKLTTNNPDIADLSNDNRPTKLAEKLGQLYDDAWTDSLEELTEIDTKLDDREAISFLLRIVMTAYQFCRGPCSMFLDLTDCQTVVTCKNSKDMTVLTKLPESLKVDIQPKTQMSLHAKDTVSEMQKKFYVILRSIIHDITRKEKFCPSVSDKTNPWKLDEDEVKESNRLGFSSGFTIMHIKDSYIAPQISNEEPANLFRHTEELSKCKMKKNSMSSISDFLQTRYEIFSKDGNVLKKEDIKRILTTKKNSQKKSTGPKSKFLKTTHFAERCVELCWFMQITQPPIHLSARVPDDGMMNNDIFKAYMKSGTEIDYIVWPVMYLHENGPLLTKGIAQPK